MTNLAEKQQRPEAAAQTAGSENITQAPALMEQDMNATTFYPYLLQKM